MSYFPKKLMNEVAPLSRSHYDILYVRPNATADEIKAAYQNLVWKAQSEGGQEALREINTAYAVLSSPHRRAEYDQGLAAGRPAAAQQAEVRRPRYDPPRFDGPGTEGPGFHPLLRLFGALFEVSHMISRVRYWFIPMNLLLGVAAVVGFVATLSDYRDAPARQAPHVTTVQTIIDGKETHDYVTVTGRRSKEHWYRSTGDGPDVYYYAVIAGDDVLIMSGKNLPESGAYTGQITPLPNSLRKLVEEDARDPKLRAGVTIGTISYLNTAYKPTTQRAHLIYLILLGAAAPILLIPPLLRYSLFSTRRGSTVDPLAEGPQWPISVLATGRFRADTGKRSTEVQVPAYLVRTGNPERPLEVRFDQVTKDRLISHVLPIPADSEVAWGYEFANFRPVPALSFGKLAKVTLPTETDARWIAEMFASGNLHG